MKIDQHTDPMAYQPDMEITSSAIMEQVLAARAAYDETVYTADDVKQGTDNYCNGYCKTESKAGLCCRVT